MRNTHDGGPAFPVDYSQVGDELIRGMSLRDYFAAADLANTQMVAEGWLGRIWEWLWWGPGREPWEVARDAYEMADAMLRRRDLPHVSEDPSPSPEPEAQAVEVGTP